MLLMDENADLSYFIAKLIDREVQFAAKLYQISHRATTNEVVFASN
jgi:hypothetical protein